MRIALSSNVTLSYAPIKRGLPLSLWSDFPKYDHLRFDKPNIIFCVHGRKGDMLKMDYFIHLREEPKKKRPIAEYFLILKSPPVLAT